MVHGISKIKSTAISKVLSFETKKMFVVNKLKSNPISSPSWIT